MSIRNELLEQILLATGGGGGYTPISGATTEVSTNHNQAVSERLIFTTGDLTLTMLDPNTVDVDQLIVRSMSGTCTFSASVGSVETVSITSGSAVTLAPRASDNSWREI